MGFKKNKTPWNKGLHMWADKNHPRGSLGKSPRNKIEFSEKDKAEIKRLYEEELLNPEVISKRFKCSEMPIVRILKEMKVNMGQSFRRNILLKAGKMIAPHKDKFHSLNTKDKLSRIKKKLYSEGKLPTTFKLGQTAGINSYNWQGGISFEPYTSEFNNKFKKEIILRDNNCLICGSNNGLSVHHVNYNKLQSFKENCICLCGSCHTKTNFNRKQWQSFCQSLLFERYGYKYSQDGEMIINLNKEDKFLCGD